MQTLLPTNNHPPERRGFAKALVTLTALATFNAHAAEASKFSGNAAAGPHSKPNIVLIMSDDHTWTDVGCEGNPDLKTPNLDRLAVEGVRFRQAFTSSSVCAPTRFQIQTGHFPAFGRVYGNNYSGLKGKTYQPMPRLMQAAGYTCALAGKQHFPDDNQPADQRLFNYEYLTEPWGQGVVAPAAGASPYLA